ncbi:MULTISPECIES: hypothetical protein [Bacillus]|uniref:hypothetical protein n=1 Tax=Bacillus TaxID=1386 RepID=UPI001145A26F|nr:MULTISPECIES: hypothetical protein [Bacillus]KAA0815472.1 hypothetical protein EI974_16490 [Bacillus licheniformis]KAA0830969.1 hypothetical protein EI980_12445 [Bacillus licheniformis]KAA0847523.1 hypothetical protein EI975_07420 [Bacillus licheniformis]MCU4667602.1 hypothetical protein [Bacillus paralicheniformis]MEC3834223.1 hypothetical protein [Bacillus licheniformis]
MATRADVKCHNCENTFQVFWHSFEKQLPIMCPYCSKELDEAMTEKLKNALGTVWNLNYHFRKNHEERKNEPLFTVDFVHVHVPIEKFDLDN